MGSIPSEKVTIFRSKLPDIYIPNHLPLHSYCFQNLHQFSDRPCLIDGFTNKTLTYAEVELASRRVATGLHRLGIRQGHVIMLLLPNSTEFVMSFLGTSFLGAMSTTANPFYTPVEIHKQAAAADAKVVITESCNVNKVQGLKGISRIIVIDDEVPVPDDIMHFSELASADEVELPEVDINPDDVVTLPFSSGTTGLPKGVMLTHKSLVTSIAQQVDGENPNLYFSENDVLLCVLPLFHIYSLNSVLLCGLRVGAAIVLMRKFETVRLMELVDKYRVTIAPFAPPIMVEMAKNEMVDQYNLSSIRVIMSGAAPMGKELEDKMMEKLPNAKLGQGYGMTEAGALSMCLAFAKDPFEVKSGSCGTVIRNAELKIVDLDTGISLSRNQPGEICIRGHQIMKGYLNNPEATEQTIDKEGWLHTGDIGFVDDDDEIFIVDRLKELIKYKGFQVAPAELEAMLITHPNIADAAVVPMKDVSCGELPVAFIARSNGSEITEDEIKKYISKQVVFYKRIHRVFFIESIPKAPSGKILRKELRAKLAAEHPNGHQP